MVRWWFAVVLFGAVFVVPAGAQEQQPAAPESSKNAAETLEGLFQQAGLFGSWAVDCAKEASAANPHVNVSVPTEGLVMEVHDSGPEFGINQYSVLTAQRLNAGRLSVEVLFQPGTESEQRQKLVIEVRNGMRRTLFNQPEGGSVRVKDGVVVGTHIKTPALKKCG